MKRFILVLLAVLLLASCGGGAEFSEGYETARPSTAYSNINRNGMFYTDTYDGSDFVAKRLWFFDFDSMQSAIMCARPNCLHNDPDVCTSFGIDDHPTIVGDKLYYFERGSEWVSETEIHIFINVWRAEIDGGSRVKIDTVEGMEIHNMMVKGSIVYFTSKEYVTKYDLSSGVQAADGTTKYDICSYDLENKVFTNYGAVAEGYDGGAEFIGEYNGAFYIKYSYSEEHVDIYDNGFVLKDNWAELLRESVIHGYCRLDLETGEILPCDMPISSLNQYGSTKPMFARGGFYGYMDGDNTVIFDSEGAEMVLEGYELSDLGLTPINGYLFNVDDGTAIDLSNGEILEINMKIMPKYGYVLCWHDGSYIIYNQLGGSNFKKVSEDDIFAD